MNINTESPASLPILLSDQYSSLLNSLERSGITSQELLLSTAQSLAKRLGRSGLEIERFIESYRQELTDSIFTKDGDIPATIPTLADESKATNDIPKVFTTGDDVLDDTLNGGIPNGGYLVEVTGGSATGKSNFLMNLAVTVQLPPEFGGLGTSIFESSKKPSPVNVMYITTESPLSTQRLTQVTKHYKTLLQANGVTDIAMYPHLDNVLTPTTPLPDLESQDHCLYVQLPVLLARNKNIKLIILDSLTHHIRAELDGYQDRQSYVLKTARYLKQLGIKHGITIIVVNQVTDKPLVGGNVNANNNSSLNSNSTSNDNVDGGGLFLKMNGDYQLGWLYGWDDMGVVYRQLLCSRRGAGDNGDFDFDEDDDGGANFGNSSGDRTVSSQARFERKKLFESSYREKITNIKTIPALGLAWLNFIDVRICLSKHYTPILNEALIDEFSSDLGIDTSAISNDPEETDDHGNENKTKTKKTLVDVLTSNEYLANHNFETKRFLKVVFSPMINSTSLQESRFEIWNGGIRSV